VPTATAVLDKYVAAIGGRAALDQLTSIKQAATLQIPAVGLEAAVEAYMAAPNKMASKAAIPGMGEMLQGTDGTVAWDVNPMQGPRLLADKELTQMLESADFVGNLSMAADRFSTLENLGAVEFGGEKAWKLKMVRKGSGRVVTTYFSVASGLAIGSETEQESPMGAIPVSSKLSAYKAFGGILFPTRTEMSMGPQTLVTIVNEVVLNGAPASAFEIPAAVKPLIKK
jgi:predicted secreted protein